jgi:hypothetical protein
MCPRRLGRRLPPSKAAPSLGLPQREIDSDSTRRPGGALLARTRSGGCFAQQSAQRCSPGKQKCRHPRRKAKAGPGPAADLVSQFASSEAGVVAMLSVVVTGQPRVARFTKAGRAVADPADRTRRPARFESRSARVAQSGRALRGQRGSGAVADDAARTSAVLAPAGRAKQVRARLRAGCLCRHETGSPDAAYLTGRVRALTAACCACESDASDCSLSCGASLTPTTFAFAAGQDSEASVGQGGLNVAVGAAAPAAVRP